MITLEKEHYKGHIKAHPKDAKYLNKPIENYKQMMTIFRTGLTTSKYAIGSNEALGISFADSSGSSMLKSESFDKDKVLKSVKEMTKVMGEAAKDGKEGTSADPSAKRRRTIMTDEDSIALSSITDVVKDVTAAICETKVHVFNPDLYGAVM
ncbi:hypothetical protein QOZ80_3BG0287030 [Eleusine coracana subsp. coracana]|nr:hypothetical protein QOZ80_3BG0287030 [Eleusine coracana subsp. coracana]